MTYTGNLTPDGLDAKATPIDADVAIVGDSADSNRVKQTTFAQLRTWVEAFTSYFNVTSDTLDDITDGATYVKSTNDYTTTEKNKLSAIEASADVTDATNVAAAGATMNADTSMAGNGYFLDEDDMTSDDATKVASQQSIKAYVDSAAATDVQSFTGSGTYTKPSGAVKMFVQVWGGGGSGGRSNSSDNGGGGGGGGYTEAWYDAADIGATEVVTIGAGGVAITSGNSNGNVGGTTTFGSLQSAYSGGGGGAVIGDKGGGGGGGHRGGGSTSTSTSGGDGGSPLGGTGNGEDSTFGGGSGGYNATPKGGDSIYGGGGGGGNATGTAAGGTSYYGGGGGGNSGGAGGISQHGGNGGAGATSASDATAGSQPGGGGGGAEQGDTGAGGAGQVIVTTFV